MCRRLLFLAAALMIVSDVQAQVKIHDVGVRLLAKPYGIEKRIELQKIDSVHFSADGTKRLTFTLRSSGVKEVVLKKPVFSLDIVLPDGSWASLGSLSGCRITFPLTGSSNKKISTYVAEFKTKLSGSDIANYLRQAAASGARLRLIGRAEMLVNNGNKTEFSKKNLKLELGGTTKLCGNFDAVACASSRELPTVGKR